MNEILGATLWILLLLAGLVGYLLVLAMLFPGPVAKTRAMLVSAPGRSLGIGAVNAVFFLVIALVLFQLSDGVGGWVKSVLAIPGLIILAGLAIALSFGLGGMVNVLGERLLPETTALKRSVWGTICLGLACALPFAGWFLMLPYVGLTGIGAFILGFFQPQSS
jgi:hypothetical protein